MKRLFLLFFLLLTTGELTAGERVILEFDEDSQLHGELSLDTFSVTLATTQLNIATTRIREILFEEENIVLHLRNGGQLTARTPIKEFHLDSVDGRTSIEKKRVRRLKFFEQKKEVENRVLGKPAEVIWVDDAESLVGAINSDVEIHLRPGHYDLTGVALPARHTKRFHGRMLANLENLTLIGPGPSEGHERPRITTKRPGNILSFMDGKNIHLKNLQIGHALPPAEGTWGGDVLRFHQCRNVVVEDCELVGFGTSGMVFHFGNQLLVTNTVIRNCSTYTFQLYKSKNVALANCRFEGNHCGLSLQRSQAIRFDQCVFRNNKKPIMPLFITYGCSKVTVNRIDCDASNKFKQLQSTPIISFQGGRPSGFAHFRYAGDFRH